MADRPGTDSLIACNPRSSRYGTEHIAERTFGLANLPMQRSPPVLNLFPSPAPGHTATCILRSDTPVLSMVRGVESCLRGSDLEQRSPAKTVLERAVLLRLTPGAHIIIIGAAIRQDDGVVATPPNVEAPKTIRHHVLWKVRSQ